MNDVEFLRQFPLSIQGPLGLMIEVAACPHCAKAGSPAHPIILYAVEAEGPFKIECLDVDAALASMLVIAQSMDDPETGWLIVQKTLEWRQQLRAASPAKMDRRLN